MMDFEAAYEVKYFYQRFDKQQSSVTIQEGKIRLSGASCAIKDKKINPHALDRFTPSRARCAEKCGSPLTDR